MTGALTGIFQNLTLQQRFGENVGHLLDPNHASILKSAAAAATGQTSECFSLPFTFIA